MFLARVHVTHINTVSPKVTNSSTQATLLFCFIPWNTRTPWEFGILNSLATGLRVHGHLHGRPGTTHRSFGPQTLLYMELLSVLQRDTFLPGASGLFFISLSGHWVLLSWPGVLVLTAGAEGTVATV